MGSLEVVSGAAAPACAPSAPHPIYPRAGFAIHALPHVDKFSTFPHLAFLPEPPKGSFSQRCSLEESTLKWDITSDRDLLLRDGLQTSGTVQLSAETDAALSSCKPTFSSGCSVRLMQLKHRDHPAWFRLHASPHTAARDAPSWWRHCLQCMTALSDSNSLSKFMSTSYFDSRPGAGLSNIALSPNNSTFDPDRQAQLPTKRQCVEDAACSPLCSLDTTTACRTSSGQFYGVNWAEELRCFNQEAGEAAIKADPSISACAPSESDFPSRTDRTDEIQGPDTLDSEFCSNAAGFVRFSDPPTITEEQRAIIELADPNLEQRPCVRVVAAAGTGKTTTLLQIVRRLQAEAPHKRILYLVYNKEFQLQAQVTLGQAVSCLTLDACAGRYGFRDALMPWQRLEDKSFSARAQDMLRLEIDKMPWVDDSKRDADTPTQDAQKELMMKWILRTLDMWTQRSLDFVHIFSTHDNGMVPVNNCNRCFVHYPCYVECTCRIDSRTGVRSNRLPSLGRDCRRGRSVQWYMDKALEVWQAMEGGKFAPVGCSGPCGTHGFWMKKAQLEARAMPFDVILLDEAQDVTECQLTWVMQKQKHAMRFCVGDPCQRIYGFRGAINESDFETIMRAELTCKPMLLSQSFRFGSDIARVANAMLFVRFNLKLAQNDTMRIKYQVHGKSPSPCVAIHSRSPEAAQLLSSTHTIIARTNLQLFKEVLELWDKDPSIKIHVNGATTRLRFKNCLREIEAAFPLYAAHAGAQYKKFSSWSALRRFAESQQDDNIGDDSSVLAMMVCIIETYREYTLIKCDNFKRAMLAVCRQDEANVVVTTTHQAKGMEYDIVRLCDDFAELSVFEKNEDKFRVSAEDMNLWYVAVTRARRVVVLPPKFMELAYTISETLDECTSTTGADSLNPNAVTLRARAKLFYNWPLALLVQAAESPLSPARVRSLVDARTP
jgi:hypothetical protein